MSLICCLQEHPILFCFVPGTMGGGRGLLLSLKRSVTWVPLALASSTFSSLARCISGFHTFSLNSVVTLRSGVYTSITHTLPLLVSGSNPYLEILWYFKFCSVLLCPFSLMFKILANKLIFQPLVDPGSQFEKYCCRSSLPVLLIYSTFFPYKLDPFFII